MKSGARFIGLYCVFLINCYNLCGTNDTLRLIARADSFFLKSQYYEAGNYYQKASYYSLSPGNKVNLLLSKVNCLKQTGNFQEAEKIVSRTDTDLPDSLLSRLLIEGAFCSYLSSQYKKAESYLITLDYKLVNKEFLKSSLPLYALILNEQARWPEAREKLIAFVNTAIKDTAGRRAYWDEINQAYLPANLPKLKNPNKARRLSHIVPGLGQMYAGYYGEGITSLALNVVTVAAAVTGIYFQYYFTSIILGNYFIGKFYLGNVSRAEFLTNKRNYLVIKRCNEKLKSLIIQFYK